MASLARLLGACALLTIAVAGCAPSAAELSGNKADPIATTPAAPTIPLEIRTAKGTLRYRVEIARTAQEQALGLMYRTSLPDHGGMIFPMVPPRFASFWMKNTLIPLDMIFIRPDGTIESIIANVPPETLDPRESGEPVAAVLELAGGAAAAAGIAPGDRVTWKN